MLKGFFNSEVTSPLTPAPAGDFTRAAQTCRLGCLHLRVEGLRMKGT